MLRNYLLAAIRFIRKNKLHTLINVSGLSVGMAASLLAVLFVLDEQGFDQFHNKADRIYRLNKTNTNPETGKQTPTSETAGMMGPALVSDYPMVERFARLQPWYNEAAITSGDKTVMMAETEVIVADSNFFHLFDFSLISGTADRVLSRPSTMVLTEAVANSLFGDEDPVGRTVKGPGSVDFEITGVVATPPRQSHIQFKALISWSTTEPTGGALPRDWMNNWIAQGITTYLLLQPDASPEDLEAQLPLFMKKHLPERTDRYALHLQPFREVYLHSHDIMGNRFGKSGNVRYVYTFIVIAGVILFIACINYVNIAASRSTARTREVGMRKTMGAAHGQLIMQFLGESLVMVTLSAILALAILLWAIPWFNQIADKSLPLSLLLQPKLIAAAAGLIVIVALSSGSYPAVLLAAFNPAQIFRPVRTRLSQWPRMALITLQFSIATALVSAMIIVNRQMEFVRNLDPGFDREHIMVVNLREDMATTAPAFREQINALTGVRGTSLGRTALGAGGGTTMIKAEGKTEETEARMFPVDGDFESTYALSMKSGHFFRTGSAADSNAIVINETLANRLGWSEALQKTIKIDDGPASPVIGVIKDFQYNSLYDVAEPVVMWISRRTPNFISVRFTGNPGPLLTLIGDKWKSHGSRYPFSYYFLDQRLAEAYDADQRLFSLLTFFSGLSVFISCLGLYGLVSLTLEQRMKEFGIRRALGATWTQLHTLLSGRFSLLLLIASLTAAPLISYLATGWLSRFTASISPGTSPYIIALMLTWGTMLLAITLQLIQFGQRKTSDVLRD